MIAKVSLGINILLIIAVGYLFLSRPKSAAGEQSEAAPVEIAPAFRDTSNVRPTVVAFINTDSINARYKFILDKTASLESNLKRADARLKEEYDKRQKEADELIAYAQSKQLPEDEQQTIQMRMLQLEQEIAEIDQKLKDDLMNKEALLQEELQKKVAKYLETFSSSRGIDYVLSYSESVPLVMYGNKSYEVTSEVIAGLNEEYAKETGANK